MSYQLVFGSVQFWIGVIHGQLSQDISIFLSITAFLKCHFSLKIAQSSNTGVTHLKNLRNFSSEPWLSVDQVNEFLMHWTEF